MIGGSVMPRSGPLPTVVVAALVLPTSPFELAFDAALRPDGQKMTVAAITITHPATDAR
jgi:hypothetical protein